MKPPTWNARGSYPKRLSVSSNGSTWVKPARRARRASFVLLSVSSNGSTWVKPGMPSMRPTPEKTFSILERIDVGETNCGALPAAGLAIPFSILERIDVGETNLDFYSLETNRNVLSVSSNGSTWVKPPAAQRALRMPQRTFSILERIDVGETRGGIRNVIVLHPPFSILERIDVGETDTSVASDLATTIFQYPRTDRRG